MTEFVHYGHKGFDKSLFRPIVNQPYPMTKPEGGFWASPVDAEYGWKQWCHDNDTGWCSENNCFRFTLKDDANVILVASVDDLQEIPERNDRNCRVTWFAPDFDELVKRGVDAIWLVDTSALYWQLYGWDCDSILILNPDIVEEIK